MSVRKYKMDYLSYLLVMDLIRLYKAICVWGLAVWWNVSSFDRVDVNIPVTGPKVVSMHSAGLKLHFVIMWGRPEDGYGRIGDTPHNLNAFCSK